jgi:Skp family chaperone for outer membrane proteins
MKRWTVHLLWASLLVTIVALSRAETRPAASKPGEAKFIPNLPGPGKIAVVDVKYIIRHHNQSQKQLSEIRSKLKEVEASIRKGTAELEQLDRQQADPATSGADREKNLAKRDELLKSLTATEDQQKQLQGDKLKIFNDMLTKIDRKISEYARRNELNFVLNFCPEPVDVDKPLDVFSDFADNPEPRTPTQENVMAHLSRTVLCANPKSDITPWIMQSLSEEAENTLKTFPAR